VDSRSVTGMISFVVAVLSLLSFRLRRRASLELEVIVLRHKLSVLQRQCPRGLRAPAARQHRGDLPRRSTFGRCVSRRRLRGMHRASEVPARASPGDPHHESPQAPVRRRAAAHQGDPACLRRARRLEADVRGVDPRRRTLARQAHERVRTASAPGNPRRVRQSSRRAIRARRRRNYPRIPNLVYPARIGLDRSAEKCAVTMRLETCLPNMAP